MRTIIDLPADQLDALADICRRDGVSRAEAIRQAVASHLQRERNARPARAFGLWQNHQVDGIAYERRLRREWPDRAVPARPPSRSRRAR